ncbi:hypothetical protein SAMN04244560_00910 [Thermoanaerobacter thermohydrosulfuricus]|uniref:Uncharacterized protein n=1 Tax=Thermoanaerobacter thermohydrosulfuricus TaxID=1516 RepID=A0A1G7M4N2_THETY|nr:hypothetical protein SAMN04244560_00910 [Thermoanaerobacter thermohydrosulfuricus]
MFNKYILMNESGEVNTMQNNKRAFVLERFGCGSCVTEAKGIVILIVVSFLLRMMTLIKYTGESFNMGFLLSCLR